MTPPNTTFSPTASSSAPSSEIAGLQARVAELQRERDHLVAVVDILQEISSSLHFVDILQAIARKLGQTFGLDRCSIFLAGESEEVRLVASYEDPSIRNLVVDLDRYPELRQAFGSGETVFIPDAANDPMLPNVREQLHLRTVRSIVFGPDGSLGASCTSSFAGSGRRALRTARRPLISRSRFRSQLVAIRPVRR